MKRQYLTINQAAKRLGVSAKTLRRWEEKGILVPKRSIGNQRRYLLSDIEKREKKAFTINEAAARLYVSANTLRRWEAKGIITPKRSLGNQRFYTLADIQKLEAMHYPTVAKEETTTRKQTPEPVITVPTQSSVSEAPLLPSETIQPNNPVEKPRFFDLASVEEQEEKLTETRISPVIPNTDAIKTEQLQKITVTPPSALHGIPKPIDAPPKQPHNNNDLFTKKPSIPWHLTRPSTHWSVALSSFIGVILILAAFTTYGDPVKILSFIPYLNISQNINHSSDEDVLQSATARRDLALRISLPVEILQTASIAGNLTAPNILYSVVAGDNITISGDPQNPTISTTVEDLASLGFVAGEGIAFDGTTIINTSPSTDQNTFTNIKIGSDTIAAGNDDDTFELAAGSNISLSTDTSNKKITISASGGSSGGISGIEVLEEGTTVSDSITALDFLGGDFDVGESPSGQANIQLASTLTSVTGVTGNFSVGGSLILNGDTVSDFTGTNTGITVDGGSLSLITSCADNEVLKYTALGGWDCGSDAGAGASVGGMGAANQIAFWSDAATLAGNNNFYWDNEIERLGIGTNSPDATLELLGNTNHLPAALFSANTSASALIIDNATGDLFTASSSGQTRFTISNDGDVTIANDLTVAGDTLLSGDLFITGVITNPNDAVVIDGSLFIADAASTSGGLTTPDIQTTNNSTLTIGGNTTGNINLRPLDGSGTLALNLSSLTINGTTGQTLTTASCVTTTNGIVTGASDCNTPSSIFIWNTSSDGGAIIQGNTTQDLLIGGTATESAKFAVLNVAEGTPIASLSGQTGGMFVTADGQLQTTNKQTLTIGGSDTGEVVISGLSSGFVRSANGVLSAAPITLPGDVTGLLALENGGTNANLTANSGGVVYSDADSFEILAPGAAGQALISGGTSAPSWFAPTQGSLIFAGANGALSQDNASLFFNDTTNRLGIGTTNPLATLDVAGNASFSGSITFADGPSMIETSAYNTLTLGSDTTGNIILRPHDGEPGSNVMLDTETVTFEGTTSITASSLDTLNVNDLTVNANTLTLDSTDDIVLDADGADILLRDGGAAFATFTNSSTDLILDIAGNNLILADGVTLNVGNGGAAAYNSFADAFTNVDIVDGEADLFIGDELEVNGNVRLDGATITLGNAAFNSCTALTTSSGTITCSTAQLGSNWDVANGTIAPKFASVVDLLIGGTATESAKFAVLNVGNGTPTASLSGQTGAAYLTASGSLQTTHYQQLTFGGDTTGDIGLSPKGGIGTLALNVDELTINGTTGASSPSLTCVSVENGIVIGFGGCSAGAGGSKWDLGEPSGVLYPQNPTVDLLIGGTSTESAKFAVLNVAGGTPTASVSAETTGATFLTALGELQTTNLQSLILGGGDTGDVSITVGSNNLLINGTAGSTISGIAQCVTTTNGIVTGQGDCPLAAANFIWQTDNGTIFQGNTTQDLLIGGVSTESARFHVWGATDLNTPVASITGSTSQAGLIVDNSIGDLFTASSSGLTRFTIAQNGTIIAPAYAGSNALLYADATTGQFATLTTSSPNLCLVSGANTPSWSSCSAAGSNWDIVNGTIAPKFASVVDLLIGGTSTESARFHVWGVTDLNTPVASITGSTSQAGLIVDNSIGDLFAASSSGLTRFVINNNGNVGIGTALPSENLTVAGNILATNGSAAVTIEGNNGLVLVGDGTNELGIYGSGALEISRATNDAFIDLKTTSGEDYDVRLEASSDGFGVRTGGSGSQSFLVDATGNLHLFNYNCTTNANGGALTVDGAGLVSCSDDDGGAGGGELWNAANGAITQKITTQDLLIGGVSTESARFHVWGSANGSATPVASISGNTSDTAFIVDNSGSGSLFTAASSGLARFTINQAGNIGIGTTTPEAHLQINNTLNAEEGGSTNLSLLLHNTSNTAGQGPGIGFMNSGGTGHVGAKINFIRTGSNSQGDLAFYVKGNTSSGDTTSKVLQLSATNGSPIATISGTTSGTGLVVDNTTGDLFRAASSGLTRFIIGQNGNIGIGTANPTLQLHLHDSTGSKLLLTRNDTSTTVDELLGGIGFDSNDGNIPSNILHAAAGIYGYAAETHSTGDKGGYLTFNTSPIDQDDDTANIERMRLTDAGNLIIGGTTAFSGSELRISGTTPAITIGDAGAEDTMLHFDGNAQDYYIGLDDTDDYLKIGRGSAIGTNTTLSMDSSGNVAIGTTTFSEKLTVSGGAIGGNTAFLPLYTNWNDYGTGDGGAGIYNDNGTYDRLMIVGNDNLGSVRRVGLWDYVTVDGRLGIGNGLNDPAVPLDVRSSASVNFGGTYWYLEYNHVTGTFSGSNPYSAYFSNFIRAQELHLHSDQRLKNFVADLDPEEALNAISQLRPLFYEWKPEASQGIPGMDIPGFFAQELETILPGAVLIAQGNHFEDERTLNYNALTTYAISALQGLNRKVDASNSALFRNLAFTPSGDLNVMANNIQAQGLNVTGNVEAQNLTLGGVNLNDKLIGLESGIASVSAGFASPLTALQSQVVSLSDRIASLEASLAFLNSASGSALFTNNPLGNFTASSGAELSLDSLEVNGQILADSLSVLGYTTMNELSVTGSIRTGVLTIKGQSNGGASISTLNGDLRLQDQGFGGIDILDGLVTIDTSGNITSEGNITIEGALTAQKINVDESNTLSASVGQGTIPLNGTNAIIYTTAVTSDSHIFITPRTKTNLQLSVTTQVSGSHFKVEITSPAPQAIKFDWFIVN